MKKLIISLSVLTVLFSVALAGCGDKKDGEVSTTSTTTTTTTTTRTTTEADKTSGTSDKENLEDKITSALTDMSTMMDE